MHHGARVELGSGGRGHDRSMTAVVLAVRLVVRQPQWVCRVVVRCRRRRVVSCRVSRVDLDTPMTVDFPCAQRTALNPLGGRRLA